MKTKRKFLAVQWGVPVRFTYPKIGDPRDITRKALIIYDDIYDDISCAVNTHAVMHRAAHRADVAVIFQNMKL